MKTFRRFRFKRRFIRRTGRIFRKRFARPGTKRFFMKQRKNAKPEVKWIDFHVNPVTTVAANSRLVSLPISPTAVAKTPSTQGIIGSQFKTRKLIVDAYMSLSDNQQVETDRSDNMYRVIFWYPTQNFTFASEYFTNLSLTDWLQKIDWNIVRVVRDFQVRLGYDRYVFTAGNQNVVAPKVYPSVQVKRFVIPWPRTVHVQNNSIAVPLDINKDILYMTVYNVTSLDFNIDIQTKMTFIDP